MTFDVETKDCTALSDAELADMADIVADGPAGLDIGLLSKQRDEWVLVTQVRDEAACSGFSFCTLERIGGTPCVLWGLVSVKRCAESGGGPRRACGPTSSARLSWPSPTRTCWWRRGYVDPGGFAGLQRAGGDMSPSRLQGLGRGAGVVPAPGQALRGRGPGRRPQLRGPGRRVGVPGVRLRAPGPGAPTPRSSARSWAPWTVNAGRPDRVRLGHVRRAGFSFKL